LQQVSQQTGGTHFADPSAAQLSKVYADLGSRIVAGHRRHDLSAATAVIALAFILAGVGLSGIWFGRLA
jgi:hypothetical protein